MRRLEPAYLHLPPDREPPPLEWKPFLAVVVIEDAVTDDWQDRVSDWLVASGCLYMMAWGRDCSSWDDSVDFANLRPYDFGDVPDDRFVMTTWHEDETLEEVFWFARNAAYHPTIELEATLIVHIARAEREAELLSIFQVDD